MTEVRKILREYKIRPKKKLGQAFLEDKNIIDKIIRAADLAPDDVVVEIGAGLGIMTELLALRVAQVVALEVDTRLTTVLRERFHGQTHITVAEQDVLSFDFSSIPGGTGAGKIEGIKVIGNIPYNISTQILFRVLRFRRTILSCLLLFQKEVVDRIIAPPGSKEYGIPSVVVSQYTRATKIVDVPARCFYPQPQVTSSLLKLVMRRTFPVEPIDDRFFLQVVRTAFAKRRKTIFNNLRTAGLFPSSDEELEVLLEEIGIDGSRRGETLSTSEFVVLSNALFRAGFLHEEA